MIYPHISKIFIHILLTRPQFRHKPPHHITPLLPPSPNDAHSPYTSTLATTLPPFPLAGLPRPHHALRQNHPPVHSTSKCVTPDIQQTPSQPPPDHIPPSTPPRTSPKSPSCAFYAEVRNTRHPTNTLPAPSKPHSSFHPITHFAKIAILCILRRSA